MMLSKTFSHLTKRKLLKTDIFLLVTLLVSLIGFLNIYKHINTDISRSTNLINPWLAITDTNKNNYIIDKQRTRILKIDQNNKIQFEINKSTNKFNSAMQITTSNNGDFYIHDVIYNGSMQIEKESIQKYNKYGNFIDVIYEKIYEDSSPSDLRRIFSLTTVNENILFVELEDNNIKIMSIDKSGKASIVKNFYYENASNVIQDCSIDTKSNNLYFIDRRGSILCSTQNQGLQTIYTVQKDSFISPFQIQNYDNQIYFLNKFNSTIYKVEDQNKIASIIDKSSFIKDGNSSPQTNILYSFNISQTDFKNNMSSKITTLICDNILYSTSLDGQILSQNDSFQKSDVYIIKEIITYLSIFLLFAIALYFIIRIFLILFGHKLKLSTPQKIAAIVFLTIIISSTFVIMNLISQFKEINLDSTVEDIASISETVSKTIAPSFMEKIDSTDDFMNEDYQNIRREVNKVIYHNNKTTEDYCVISKYNNGIRWAILDTTLEEIYPLNAVDSDQQDQVYKNKQIISRRQSDAYGTYTQVKNPILNNLQEVVGVVEIGRYTTFVENKINTLATSMVVSVVLMLTLIIILLNELFSIWDEFKTMSPKKEKPYKNKIKTGIPVYWLRPILFTSLLAFNMSVSFLPVYIMMFYSENLGIPESLAASLPMSIHFIFFALISLFCTKLLNKIGFKNVVILGSIFAFAGQLLLATAGNYFVILFALVFDGIGCGMIANCINTYISNFEDHEEKEVAFSAVDAGDASGMNFGALFGALIASKTQNIIVFYVATSIWVLVFLAFLLFKKHINIPTHPKSITNKKDDQSISLLKFIFSRSIISYILLITIPYLALDAFIEYFIPVYTLNYGLNVEEISLLIVIYYMCRSFLSTSTTKFINSRFKKWSIYISSSISFLALSLFAYLPILPILIITTFLLGIGASFGNTVNIEYFLSQDIVKKYGEQKSMDIYSFIRNTGYSIGPIIFGLILSFGASLGILIFVMVAFVFLLIYKTLTISKKE